MYYVVVPVLVLFARSRIIILLHNIAEACSGSVRASLGECLFQLSSGTCSWEMRASRLACRAREVRAAVRCNDEQAMVQ